MKAKNEIGEERPNYIDYTKFIVMFLVIYGHYIPYQGLAMANNMIWNSVHFISLFHMPVFFLISGILYKRRDPAEDIRNIAKKLIVPYLLLSSISLLIGLIFFSQEISWKYLCKCILGIASGGELYGYGVMPFSGPLWFCYALILIRLMMNVLTRLPKPNGGGYFICIVGILIMYLGNIFPCKIDSALVGWIYFFIGFRFKAVIERIDTISFWQKSMTVIISVLVCIIIVLLIDDIEKGQVLSINVVWFNRHPIAFLMGSLIGSIGMLSLGSCFSKIKSTVVLTNSNGMIVTLGFQQLLYIAYSCVVEPSYSIFKVLMSSAEIYFLCYLLIVFCVRNFPLIMGNRCVK